MKLLKFLFLFIWFLPNSSIFSQESFFMYPIQPKDDWTVYSSGDFGAYRTEYLGYHSGEDWNLISGNDLGKPVYCIANGVIEKKSDLTSLGWCLVIRHDAPLGTSFKIPFKSNSDYTYAEENVNKIYSVYIHITNIPSNINSGTNVSKGTILGYIMDPSGGPHLHFEIRHPNALHSSGGSMILPTTNWAPYGNTNTNGHYLNMQTLVNSGARKASEFLDANIQNQTLSAPILLSPNNNEPRLLNENITFIWMTVDGATSYEIQFNNESPISIPSSEVSYTRTFSTAGTYTWKVRAKNSSITSSWSDTRNVQITKATPSSPGTNTAPGEIITTLTPIFSWNKAAGAYKYGIYVSVEPYGEVNSIFQEENISKNISSYQLPGGKLESGKKYRWKLGAFDSQNNLYLSEPLYFQTSSSNETCHSLLTNVSPANSGNISINTSQNCTNGYSSNTQISLVAIPSVGYIFNGWSGTGGTFSNGSLASTVFTINGNASVTASFQQTQENFWQAMGLTNQDVYAVGFSSNGNILIGTASSGIYISSNNGVTWSQSNNGLSTSTVLCFVTAPNGNVFAGTSKGVFRSTNNGQTWVQVGLTTMYIRSLRTNSNNGYIFCGLDGGNIGRSTNNGDSWDLFSVNQAGQAVMSIVNQGSRYSAGTLGDGIFFSTDNGIVWDAINSGLTNKNVFTLATNSSSHIYAGTQGGGVFFSSNNGSSWQEKHNGLTEFYVQSITISSNNQVFAGTTNGVFLSANNGETWSPENTGLTNKFVRSLAISSSNYLFAGTSGGGIYRSIDPIASVTQYTITTSSNPTHGGNTSGGGTYNSSQGVTVVAAPNPGWSFVNWTEGGIEESTNPNYTFTVTANRSLVANFTQQQYTINCSANPPNGGTTSGCGTFTSGTQITVIATPNSGWNFVNWTEGGIIVSTSQSYPFSVEFDRTLVANFSPAPCSITWQSTVTISDGCSGTNTLTFGSAPCATDDIDANLGESELPPLPPGGVFDARFVLPSPYSTKSSLKDFREDAGDSKTWRITFQPGSCGYPITFNWNNSSLPAGSFFLKDETTVSIINVNMKTQNSYTLSNTGITSLKIEYSTLSCKDVAVNSGWNIISVPLIAVDMNVSSLFPGAASSAFEYNLGYTTATVLTSGKGYWLKFNNANTFNICGSVISPKTISVNSGWNIIGPFENDIQTISITTSPGGIIASPFYGYNNGYTTASTLQSGKGYWVKTSQAGSLNLNGGTAKTGDTDQQTSVINSFWARIEIEDNSGSKGALYFAKSTDITKYELPPIPPLGIFDIRFAGDRGVEDIDKDIYEIQINSASYPIKFRIYNFGGQSLRIKDLFGGKIIDEILQEGDELIISKQIERLLVERQLMQNKFELSQNYPNPFNPVTMIKIYIPQKAKVSLSIYNLLGEKIAELIDDELETGTYETKWIADEFTSGIYFYRLQAATTGGLSYSHIITKKLMLMK